MPFNIAFWQPKHCGEYQLAEIIAQLQQLAVRQLAADIPELLPRITLTWNTAGPELLPRTTLPGTIAALKLFLLNTWPWSTAV